MNETTTNPEDLLTIDEAVAALQTSRSTVYRWLRTGELKGTKVGRQWRIHPDEIARFMKGEHPSIDSPPEVDAFVEEIGDMLRSRGAQWEPSETSSAMSAVLAMSQLAVASKAEHFALEPHLGDDGSVDGWFRMRVDGALSTQATLDAESIPAVVEGWKRRAGCDPHKQGSIQRGRVVLHTGAGGRACELRVTIVPTVLGEAVSVTLLDPGRIAQHVDLDRLDFSPADRDRIDKAIGAPSGLTVVTGPTDTGKSTFLYACLTELSDPQRHTIAIESVSEWRVPGVVHVPVQADKGVTFPASIRAAFECDPDVVMVAEIQDEETLELVGSSALVGHLMLTALHAPDAISALMRMIEFGLDRQTVAEATRLVVGQRLVRRLCTHCAVDHTPPPDELERARFQASVGGVDPAALGDDWKRPKGCPKCAQTGYRGRRVIAETVSMTGTLREALLVGATAEELEQIAIADGTTTLLADGIRRASVGETSLDEVWRVSGQSPMSSS